MKSTIVFYRKTFFKIILWKKIIVNQIFLQKGKKKIRPFGKYSKAISLVKCVGY